MLARDINLCVVVVVVVENGDSNKLVALPENVVWSVVAVVVVFNSKRETVIRS